MSDLTGAPPIDPDEPPSDEVLAGEYALGVLAAAERAEAEVRMERDESFGRQVLAWAIRLAPLIGEVRPVEPSTALWSRIESALPGPVTAAAPVSQGPVSQGASPAPLAPLETPRAANVNLWRGLAAGAAAVAAAALVFIAVRPPAAIAPTPTLLGKPGGTLVATLALSTGAARTLTVAYDPGQARLYSAPDQDFSVPKARSAELWLIPADGKPRPLGVIDPSKPASMPIPDAFRAVALPKATLALSIEPEGGSKTGAPTGPVIASGALASI